MKASHLLSLTAGLAILSLSPALARAEENSDMKAALDECSASATTDENGRPDRTAMDECMTGKGFTKPIGKKGRGRPGQGGQNEQAGSDGQYVDRAALEAAMTECKSAVSTDENGEPNRQEVDTCMEVKGFKKPEKEGRHPRRPHGASGNASKSSTGSSSYRGQYKSAK